MGGCVNLAAILLHSSSHLSRRDIRKSAAMLAVIAKLEQPDTKARCFWVQVAAQLGSSRNSQDCRDRVRNLTKKWKTPIAALWKK